MRVPVTLLAFVLLASACASAAPVFRDMAACVRAPDDEGSASLASLVDRAALIALVTVVRTESLAPTAAPGQPRDLVLRMHDEDGQRVTLRTVEAVKGTPAAEIVVHDAPCRMLAAIVG